MIYDMTRIGMLRISLVHFTESITESENTLRSIHY